VVFLTVAFCAFSSKRWCSVLWQLPHSNRHSSSFFLMSARNLFNIYIQIQNILFSVYNSRYKSSV